MLLVKLAQENSLMCGPFCANIRQCPARTQRWGSNLLELEEKIKTKKILPSLFGNFTLYQEKITFLISL